MEIATNATMLLNGRCEYKIASTKTHTPIKKFHKYFNNSSLTDVPSYCMRKYLNIVCCWRWHWRCCSLVEYECLTSFTAHVLSNIFAHFVIKVDTRAHTSRKCLFECVRVFCDDQIEEQAMCINNFRKFLRNHLL